MIFLILITCFFFCLLILACGREKKHRLKMTGIFGSGFVMVESLALCFEYDGLFARRPYSTAPSPFGEYNIDLNLYLDGFAILLIGLTAFLVFLCVAYSVDEDLNLKQNLLILAVLEFFLVIVFSTSNLFVFYFFFEAILLPMYLLIGVGGSRDRKTRASTLFFYFTFIGSLLLLLGIIDVYVTAGTADIVELARYPFSVEKQRYLWWMFFFSFATKVPLFPFHIWLPEAHVEAPTIGSVLLAGIMLKLGIYGFYRFSIQIFSDASVEFSPVIFVLGACGVVFGSLAAILQTDIKRIIAYSSIAHMNLIMIGLFSFVNPATVHAALFQTISHGLVSSGLFFLVGMLYKRVQSRDIRYLSGIVHTMPIYSAFFLFFTFANVALPGTSGFVGEAALLVGIWAETKWVTALVGVSMVLGGAYSFWLLNRLVFGSPKRAGCFWATSWNCDLTKMEITILMPLAIGVLIMGFYPECVLCFF